MRKLLTWLAACSLLAAVACGTADAVRLPIKLGGTIVLSLATTACPSGVAPCSVHFDATGTTDVSVTSQPFHEVQYSWDFGDSTCVAGEGVVAGTWDYGSRAGVSSRNTATGPVASHMFECAGSFTVTLTAYDGTNTAQTTTGVTVTSADSAYPTTNTICYRQAATGDFSGCPSGATQSTEPSCSTIASAATANKRILFRRGDTWTSCSPLFNATGGHGLVGAFGSGAKPILRVTSAGTGLVISTCSTPTMSDWRFMDLDIDGVGTSAGTQGIVFNGGADYITLLRMTVRNFPDVGIQAIDPVMSGCIGSNPSNHIWLYTAIVDSTLTTMDNYVMLIDAKSFTWQGNNITNGGVGHGAHTIRTGLAQKSIMSNNDVSVSTAGIWTNRAPDFANATAAVPAGTYTEKNVYSDNKIFGASASLIVVFDFRPTNSSRDERIRDVIFERNLVMTAASGADTGMQINAQYVTVRNNLFDLTLGNGHGGIAIGVTGIEPGPFGIKAYNNTFFSSATGFFTGFGVNSGTLDGGVTIVNNLGYAPNATTPNMISNACGTCVTSSNNTSNTATSPPLTTSPPTQNVCGGTNHWKPTGTPVQSVSATSVPVFSDFCLVAWPATWDIGAVKH